MGQRQLFPAVYDRPPPVDIPRAIPPDLGVQPTPVVRDRSSRALSPADREAAETLERALQLNLPPDAVEWKCVVCKGSFPHRQCATCHEHIHLRCFGRQRPEREDAGDNSEGLECPRCVADGGGHSGEPREPVDRADPWFAEFPKAVPPPAPERGIDDLGILSRYGADWEGVRAPDPLPEPPGWASLTIDARWEHRDRVRVCDSALILAVQKGMPHWHSEGTGGWLPHRCCYVFGEHAHVDGAKADFYRGNAEDDLQNAHWVVLYLMLPRYVQWIDAHQGAGSDVTRGNAMESIVALCFHAATNGRFLPGHLDWTGGGRHPSSQPYFALAWWHLQTLGIRPSLVRSGDLPYTVGVMEQSAGAAQAALPLGPAFKAAPAFVEPSVRPPPPVKNPPVPRALGEALPAKRPSDPWTELSLADRALPAKRPALTAVPAKHPGSGVGRTLPLTKALPVPPAPRDGVELREESVAAEQCAMAEGAATSRSSAGISGGADSGGLGAQGDPASVGVQSARAQPLAKGAASLGRQASAGADSLEPLSAGAPRRSEDLGSPSTPAEDPSHEGGWQYPLTELQEFQMFREAQRQSLGDRLAWSDSDADLGSDSGSEASGDCATLGCPAFLSAWGGHRCVTCGRDFCVSCAYRCYLADCPYGVTSGDYFCSRCLGEHEFLVHNRVRSDFFGGEAPREPPGSPVSAPTTAPPSEGAPESDAPDTAFGDEEAPGASGAAPNSQEDGPQEDGQQEDGPQEGGTDGADFAGAEVCLPCAPQQSPCPGICMGFLDGTCTLPCARTKKDHNHCVCAHHDLDLAVDEAEDASSGRNWSSYREEWTNLLTRFSASWEGYATRRPVRYCSPSIADLDRQEQEEFWDMLRKFTVQMSNLAGELEATLREEGRPVPEFHWRSLPDLARTAVERIHRGTSAPIEEPEAFRGVSLAVHAAIADYRQIAGDRKETIPVSKLVPLVNLTSRSGRLLSRQSMERASRPKEYLFTAPSMVRGAACYAMAMRGKIADVAEFFTRDPRPGDSYILRLRFPYEDAAWATDAPALAASLLAAVGLPGSAVESVSFREGALELVLPSLEYARWAAVQFRALEVKERTWAAGELTHDEFLQAEAVMREHPGVVPVPSSPMEEKIVAVTPPLLECQVRAELLELPEGGASPPVACAAGALSGPPEEEPKGYQMLQVAFHKARDQYSVPGPAPDVDTVFGAVRDALFGDGIYSYR